MTPEEATEQLKTMIDWEKDNLDPLTSDQVEKIKDLVRQGADVNTILNSKEGLTLTHVGAVFGDKEFLELLDTKGVDWEKQASSLSPAHLAAHYENMTAVEFLIDKGVDFHQQDEEKHTALYYLQENLSKITDPDRKKQVEGLITKIEERAKKATEDLKSVLSNAGSTEEETSKLYDVSQLIKKGADVNTVVFDITPVMDDAGNVTGSVNENLTVAHWLAKYGDKERLKQADEHGIDWNVKHLPDTTNETVLHMAAKAGNEVALKFFIGKGIDFSQKDKDDKTALDYIEDDDKKAEIEDLIAKAEAEKAGEADEGSSHPIDPNDNGERDEGESHNVDQNDNGLNDEGETPDVPPVDEEGREPDPAPNGEEGKGKPAGTPQSKRIAGALKDATDHFFKAVFEGNHKTAEEFSQALLINLLAFPLDAIGIYLEKKYDPDEKDLLKKILDEMQKNKGNGGNGGNGSNSRIEGLSEEEDKRFTNICRLNLLLKATNPEIYAQVAGKSPEEIKAFFETNQEALEKITASLGDIAKTAGGKGIISELFPDNYNGTISKEQLLEFLSGKANNGGRGGNGNNGNGGNGGGQGGNNDISNRLLDVLSKQNELHAEAEKRNAELITGIDERYKSLLDKMDERKNQLDAERLAFEKEKASLDVQKEAERLKHEKELKEKELAYKKEFAEIEAKKESEKLKATQEMVEQTIQAAVESGKIAKELGTQLTDTVKQISADARAMNETTAKALADGHKVNTDALKQVSADTKEIQTKNADTLAKGQETNAKTLEQIIQADKEKKLAETSAQKEAELKRLENEQKKLEEEAKSKIEASKTEVEKKKIEADKEVKLAEIKAKKETTLAEIKSTEKEIKALRIKAEGKVYTDPAHPEQNIPAAEETKGTIQKENLPFKFPKGMKEENKQAIIAQYNMVLNTKEEPEKKAQLLATFIKGVNDKLPELKRITDALDLIANKKEILDQIRLTKKGEIFKADEAKITGMDKATVKLALGLRKRLEEGSKAGGTPQSNTKGKGR